MSEQEKVTLAEIDDVWNRFQDEVIAHAHDYTRREQLIKERLPELSSMIERCDDITGNRQDLVLQLGNHVRQFGLEATPTKLPILYFSDPDFRLRVYPPHLVSDGQDPRRTDTGHSNWRETNKDLGRGSEGQDQRKKKFKGPVRKWWPFRDGS